MYRRDFLKAAAVAPLVGALPLAVEASIPATRPRIVGKTRKVFGYKETCIAVLKENQRNYDASRIGEIGELFNKTPLWDIIGIQPVISDSGTAFYMDKDGDGIMIRGKMVDTNNLYDPDYMDSIIYHRLNNGITNTRTWDFNTSDGDTIKEKLQDLYINMLELSDDIFKKSGVGGCNWVIASPKIATMLSCIPVDTFKPAMDMVAPEQIHLNLWSPSIQLYGTMGSRWKIYVHYGELNEIIMGNRGVSYMSSGFILCPYHIVAPPNSDEKPLLRCGVHYANPDYYGKITVKNIPF